MKYWKNHVSFFQICELSNDTDADGDEGRHSEGLAARFKLRYKPSEKLDMTLEPDFYELVNLRAGLEGEHLEFYVWAKNVFDKHYVVFENTVKGVAEDGEPLKVGASVGYRL